MVRTMKYDVLVKDGVAGQYEDGDIIAIAEEGYPWGNCEGPPDFRIESVDDGAFYESENLIIGLRIPGVENMPLAIQKNVRLLVRYGRAKKREMISPRRYRLIEGAIEDKKYAGRD